jgi:hypothetical protein
MAQQLRRGTAEFVDIANKRDESRRNPWKGTKRAFSPKQQLIVQLQYVVKLRIEIAGAGRPQIRENLFGVSALVEDRAR